MGSTIVNTSSSREDFDSSSEFTFTVSTPPLKCVNEKETLGVSRNLVPNENPL